MSKMSELELLQDTINHYGVDPLNRRSTKKGSNSNSCVYNGPNGTHCAVGRFLMPRFKEQGDNLKFNAKTVGVLLANVKGEVMQRKVKHITEKFWANLQCLHDEQGNWNYDGDEKLSEFGIDVVKRICLDYKLDFNSLDM